MLVDRFPTVEALKARSVEIRKALDGLDLEFAGKKFPPEVREQWNDLNEKHEVVKARIEAIEVRHGRLEEVAKTTSVENGDGAAK